jgi:hypothetical protein
MPAQRSSDTAGRSIAAAGPSAGATPSPNSSLCGPNISPGSTRDSATGDALQAIIDLDLDELIAIEPPRGFGRD